MSNFCSKRLWNLLVVFVPIIAILEVRLPCPVPNPEPLAHRPFKKPLQHLRTDYHSDGEPPPPGASWPHSDEQFCFVSGERPTSLVDQAAKQNKGIVIQKVAALLMDGIDDYTEPYVGLHTFGGEDLLTQLSANIVQLIEKYSVKLRSGIFATIAFSIIWLKRRKFGSLLRLGLAIGLTMMLAGLLKPFDGINFFCTANSCECSHHI